MNDFNPKTVTIGNQVWMAENLDIDDGKGGIFYNEENGEYYYTYDAAMRIANSIPGWHLPTALEWNEAALACGAKEISFNDGSNPNYNDYKDAQELKDRLDIKLVGNMYFGSFFNIDSYAYLWTSSEFSSAGAYSRCFSTGASMDSDFHSKTTSAFTVRLVKDA